MEGLDIEQAITLTTCGDAKILLSGWKFLLETKLLKKWEAPWKFLLDVFSFIELWMKFRTAYQDRQAGKSAA